MSKESYVKDYASMTDEELAKEYEDELFDSSILYHREDAPIGTYVVRNGEIIFLYELIADEMERRGMFDDADDDYDPGYDDDSDRSCDDCPSSECTGRCFSCYYRTV